MAEAGLNARLGLDATDFERGLKKSETSLKTFGSQVNRSVPQATQAFTNLSRVVSDAPFGFIGIQNNIEPLIQSFQALKTSTGSTGGALKALAGSLAGAGGVLFAFSAVSSLITVLIQKYGSLGAAFNEFASASDRASVNQRALNRELTKSLASQEGEIVSLKTLVGILNDSNASQLQRTNAYKELKKEYPGVIQNITQENALTKTGGELIAARSVQLIKYIQLKAKEAALIKLGEAAALKQFEAAKDGIETLQSSSGFLSNLLNNILGGGNTGLGLIRRLNATGKEFDSAGKDADLFAQALDKVKREIAEFDPKLTGLEKVSTELKKKAKEVFEFGPRLGGTVQTVDVNKALKFSDFTTSADALKAFESLPKAVEKTINNQPIKFVPKINLGPEALKNINELDALKERVNGVATAFDQFLTPVINTAFEALGNGSSIFKAIGQSLKALVVQLGITIAKSAILAAILSSIGGGAGIGVTGGFGKIFGSLLKGAFGGGNIAAPNFAGVAGGGLAVTVGGQFNVRGTDLVAVVSQGNQRIGRVG